LSYGSSARQQQPKRLTGIKTTNPTEVVKQPNARGRDKQNQRPNRATAIGPHTKAALLSLARTGANHRGYGANCRDKGVLGDRKGQSEQRTDKKTNKRPRATKGKDKKEQRTGRKDQGLTGQQADQQTDITAGPRGGRRGDKKEKREQKKGSLITNPTLDTQGRTQGAKTEAPLLFMV